MSAAPDRKTLIARMKAVMKRRRNRPPTQPEFYRLTGITRYQVDRHFDGYTDLLCAAGMRAQPRNQGIPEDDLMRAMAEAFRKAKGLVPLLRFRKFCRYSNTAYDRRWRNWSGTLLAFREWQPQHDPNFPYADQLAAFRVGGRPLGERRTVWNALGGRRFGDTLNFRGLLHAPVNELGVVFLFATLATELGFLVESLTPEFPDCEAKRRVGKVWERVRIEFEYESRSFKLHRHDPKACDLIVCWEHNWPDCPLEVLELKALVTGLSGSHTAAAAAQTAGIGARPARGAAAQP